MTSLQISRTSDLFKKNLPRCNLKSGIFDSTKFQNIKQNILEEISSKWENFSESSRPDDTSSVNSMGRKTKIRSVYGQPELTTEKEQGGTMQKIHWRSLDSLDTYDSGRGIGSNSTSCSDLRMCDGGKLVDAPVSDIGTSVDSSDSEFEPYKRCPSSNSTSSGCSTESQEGRLAREAKYFMKQHVDTIFANSTLISLEEKAKFGRYARTESGRLWFARYITKERNEHKCVSESTFYSLAQYFAIILFECAEADHFIPAKTLMNMCFTFYHLPTNSRNRAPTSEPLSAHQYLYTVLRDQPIWRQLRFWNAAFFEAVQTERVTYFERAHSAHTCEQDIWDDWQFQANVTFGQLGTFTYNMHAFGLPKSLCLAFLSKQSTIANLTSEQIQLLQDNIEDLYRASK